MKVLEKRYNECKVKQQIKEFYNEVNMNPKEHLIKVLTDLQVSTNMTFEDINGEIRLHNAPRTIIEIIERKLYKVPGTVTKFDEVICIKYEE